MAELEFRIQYHLWLHPDRAIAAHGASPNLPAGFWE